jgi:hypothetical protein
MTRAFANPQDIAKAGQKIYDEKYRSDCEKDRTGQFVAIDVNTERAFVAAGSQEAVEAAWTAEPDAVLHLIRVGARGAFKVCHASNAGGDWVFRP